MRVSINIYNFQNFKGIAPRYKNQDGVYVYPIENNPSQQEIRTAIKATQDPRNQLGKAGYNGTAYIMSNNLVVKKSKGEGAFDKNNPEREINILDSMYDNGISLQTSQRGKFGFKTTDGRLYLVSSRVKGENPNPEKANFNKENLKSLVKEIANLDKGFIVQNSSKNKYSDRCRFMNYDFNKGNVKITKDTAGLFDFEYSVVENLDDMIYKRLIQKDTGVNCHQSDTAPIPSSLRSFEFYTFCDYLREVENPNELFEDYLEAKGEYHKSMSEFYNEFSKESKFPDIAKEIAKREDIHSRLLTKDANGKIQNDIKKAEAIKIQMSNLIHEQSQFCDTGRVNVLQIKEYTQNAMDYFKKMHNEAKDEDNQDRQIYYQDCLELFSSWKNVNKSLNDKLKSQNEDERQQILKKLVNKPVLTLNDVLEI